MVANKEESLSGFNDQTDVSSNQETPYGSLGTTGGALLGSRCATPVSPLPNDSQSLPYLNPKPNYKNNRTQSETADPQMMRQAFEANLKLKLTNLQKMRQPFYF